MSFTHFLSNAADYTAFGIAPSGTFAGATDGTGLGAGFEPAYFVNAEEAVIPQINWVSGNRAGINGLLLGDGTGSGGLAEIVVECKFRINDVPFNAGGGFVGYIYHIGENSVTSTSGIASCFIGQNKALTFQFGIRNGVHADVIFTSAHPVIALIDDGAWHKVRCEYKQMVPGTFESTTDFAIYIDDVLETPDDSNFATALGYFDSTETHYLAVGGADNVLSYDFSIGDIFLSSNSASFPSPPNVAPVVTLGVIAQRP